MAHLATHPAMPFFLCFPLLLEIGARGDSLVLALGLVAFFLHHIGSRSSLGSTSVFFFCPRLLLNIQRANDILNMPPMFQRSGKVRPQKHPATMHLA
jgi:hypothetical protein